MNATLLHRPMGRALLAAASLLFLLVFWELLVSRLKLPQWILPSPSSIWKIAVEWRQDLLMHSWTTLYETVAGFAAAVAVALPLAMVIAFTPLLKHTIYPALLALQSVPKVAIAPLVTLWAGFGIMPKVIVVFLVCFFPIIVSATAGLEATARNRLELMRSLRASRWQTFRRLRLPQALPQIMVGCKVGITFAVIGAVIGEFVGSEKGLGYLILTATAQSNTPLAFSALVVLTLISIVLYYLVERVEKALVRWSE